MRPQSQVELETVLVCLWLTQVFCNWYLSGFGMVISVHFHILLVTYTLIAVGHDAIS